jgi:hypothetical protein
VEGLLGYGLIDGWMGGVKCEWCEFHYIQLAAERVGEWESVHVRYLHFGARAYLNSGSVKVHSPYMQYTHTYIRILLVLRLHYCVGSSLLCSLRNYGE